MLSGRYPPLRLSNPYFVQPSFRQWVLTPTGRTRHHVLCAGYVGKACGICLDAGGNRFARLRARNHYGSHVTLQGVCHRVSIPKNSMAVKYEVRCRLRGGRQRSLCWLARLKWRATRVKPSRTATPLFRLDRFAARGADDLLGRRHHAHSLHIP